MNNASDIPITTIDAFDLISQDNEARHMPDALRRARSVEMPEYPKKSD
jgi:hypothetical protein